MQMFAYSKGQLCAEDVSLADIANRFGTPCYVYSRAEIKQQWTAFDSAFGEQRHLICYAVKANFNLAILNLLARLGSGFDIVSVGELERVLKAGGEPGKVVFSGVGKREDEMRRALDVGIKCFNVESITELERLNSVATEMNVNAPVSLRVNPDVDADTHPYIATGLNENKFGIDFAEALSAYEMAAAMENIEIIGIDCHIGSQITAMAPIVDALNRLRSLITSIEDKGISLQHIDVGGGLGICYQDETPPTVEEYVHAVQKIFADTTYELILEPGRSIMGDPRNDGRRARAGSPRLSPRTRSDARRHPPRHGSAISGSDSRSRRGVARRAHPLQRASARHDRGPVTPELGIRR